MTSRICPTCGTVTASGIDYKRHRRQCRGDQRHTYRWKQLRAQIIRRDHGQCVRCGTTEQLEVHHRDGNPANSNPDNLTTVCTQCHHDEHRQR